MRNQKTPVICCTNMQTTRTYVTECKWQWLNTQHETTVWH